ncbi:SubName: Full=Uncharacterized protein {ECO:0000313/EMBL:CCA71750.1} [Serendipita indica DSM 11827]|nr:SubName: Full=Uncharacterized protein {ECO:0000313/EMBL:CCA71750.1} [Serendipita indica DSM 11827]
MTATSSRIECDDLLALATAAASCTVVDESELLVPELRAQLLYHFALSQNHPHQVKQDFAPATTPTLSTSPYVLSKNVGGGGGNSRRRREPSLARASMDMDIEVDDEQRSEYTFTDSDTNSSFASCDPFYLATAAQLSNHNRSESSRRQLEAKPFGLSSRAQVTPTPKVFGTSSGNSAAGASQQSQPAFYTTQHSTFYAQPLQNTQQSPSSSSFFAQAQAFNPAAAGQSTLWARRDVQPMDAALYQYR